MLKCNIHCVAGLVKYCNDAIDSASNHLKWTKVLLKLEVISIHKKIKLKLQLIRSPVFVQSVSNSYFQRMIYSRTLVYGLCPVISDTHCLWVTALIVGTIDEVKHLTICLIIYWSFPYQMSSSNWCIRENCSLKWQTQYCTSDTVRALLLDVRSILRFWLDSSEQTNPPLCLHPLRVVVSPRETDCLLKAKLCESTMFALYSRTHSCVG